MSTIQIPRDDVWMQCYIEDLQRMMKVIKPGCREPRVIKTLYNALIPFATPSFQLRSLSSLKDPCLRTGILQYVWTRDGWYMILRRRFLCYLANVSSILLQSIISHDISTTSPSTWKHSRRICCRILSMVDLPMSCIGRLRTRRWFCLTPSYPFYDITKMIPEVPLHTDFPTLHVHRM